MNSNKIKKKSTGAGSKSSVQSSSGRHVKRNSATGHFVESKVSTSTKAKIHSTKVNAQRDASTGKFVSSAESKNARVLASTVGGAVIGNILFPGIGGAILGGITGAIFGGSDNKKDKK